MIVTPVCNLTIEPLYFVQITGKGVAEDDISDPFGHFIAKGKKYFQGLYLKLKMKQFPTLPTRIFIAPDEIYDTYVDFNDDFELNTDIYKMSIRKACC